MRIFGVSHNPASMPVGGVVAGPQKSALKIPPPILLGVNLKHVQSTPVTARSATAHTTCAAAVYIGVQKFQNFEAPPKR